MVIQTSKVICLLWGLLLFLHPTNINGATSDEWRSRIIYQLLTDRFAAVPTPPQCTDYSNYCGGTFQGIETYLPYIQNLGFDSIWISPVIDNSDGGYHGYWQRNMYAINNHFGTSSDLLSLANAVHEKNMYLMFDVVGNHANSDTDVSNNYPFNDINDYHNCNNCPPGCNVQNYENLTQMEPCRLAGLMDFNNSDANGSIAQQLYTWVHQLVTNYTVDGLRIDTVPYVHPSFWQKFEETAGIYAVGEVDDGTIPFVSQFQAPNGTNAALSGILSYPMFYTLRNVFKDQQSMQQISTAVQANNLAYSDPSLLGVFLDNHDNPRFMNGKNNPNDVPLYKGGLGYVLMSDGIPIVYYGSEWVYAGGNDPGCREPLWCPDISYNATAAPLGLFLSTLTNYRRNNQLHLYRQQELFVDDNFYAFRKGNNTLVVVTNIGGNNPDPTRTLTTVPDDWLSGTKFCNVLDCSQCNTVDNEHHLQLTVHSKDGVAVYDPRVQPC